MLTRLYVPASAFALAGMVWRMGWLDTMLVHDIVDAALTCLFVLTMLLGAISVLIGLPVLGVVVLGWLCGRLVDALFGKHSSTPP